MKQQFGKSATAAVLSGALMLFVAAPFVHADERDRCQHAIEKAEARLDHAIHDHGEHSRAAEARRRELNEQRERCWNENHQWWNAREHRWETEHNWEDHH